jgi:hypothetical protein
MAALARDAEAIDTGLQPLVYGERLPLGPAPATPWAKPLPGGPLRLVFIGQTNNCYDLAEVQRRVDCQIRFIHLPDQYYFAKTYPEAVAGYYSTQALRTLEHEADVILAEPLVRILSPQVAAAIQRKVQAGCGLVLLPVARWGGGGQFGYWPSTDKMEAWKDLFAALVKSAAPARYVAQHAVTSTDGLWDAVPWSLLPGHHLVGLVPADTATVLAKDGELSLAVGGPVGKGRTILLPWGTYMGCFPLAEDNQPVKIRDYQEYYASVIIRALLWAAKRPSPVNLSLVTSVQQAGVAGTAQVKLAGVSPADINLELRLRDLLCRDLWQTTCNPVAGPAQVVLPALAVGEYLLDAIARDGRGNSLGWGTWIVSVAAQGALSVSLDKEVYQPGQPATITAQLGQLRGTARESHATAQVPADNYSATLQVWDSLDRLLQEETKPLVAGRAEWTFSNRDPLCVLHYADVQVRRNGAPYLASRTDIFVPRFTFTDFHNCLWGGWLPGYATRRIDRRLREGMGCDVILCGGYGGTHKMGNYAHLASGVIPFYTNVACVSPAEVELNPDRAKREAVKSVEGMLPELKQFGGTVIFFQDERHGLSDPGKFTDEGLASFRAWLKQRYPDIAALNAAWGRKCASFDEVKPMLTKEFDPQPCGATKTGQAPGIRAPEPVPFSGASLAPWLEWRLWNMDRVVDIDRTNARRIREFLGHDAWMGLEGIFGSGHNYPYGGLDLAAQGDDCLNAAAPYAESLMNACQSFYAGPCFSWNGYGNPYSVYQRYVWARALQGDWSLGWFCGNTFYSPCDAFLPQARWVADLTRPLREGVGKLLAEHRPFQRDPVAFLYSQPSLYSLGILGKTIDPANPHLMVRPADWARDSLQRMLTDAGVQFSYVSEKQVQQGRARGMRLLVLSSCVALEPATCRALERFVADGGVILADLCPGVWDDHGTYHSPGQLDKLFGVQRTGSFAFEAMAADWGVGVFEAEPDFNIKGDWLIGQYYEKTLQVSDGRALGKHIFGPTKPPAFVFKRTGKGAAVLMNYLETEYRRVPEHSQQLVATAVLKLAGLSRCVTLRDIAKQGEPITAGVKIMRWQDGPALYVGILLDQGQNAKVELPQAGHLYDLASGGRYLGQGNSAALDLRDSPHALLAVLPYRIEGVTLRAQPGRLGQDLPLELTMRVTGGQPVRHVVHLDVYHPDGTRNYSLSRNFVFRASRWSGTLPLALNDPEGQWTVRAREVCSGLTSEVKVEVQR